MIPYDDLVIALATWRAKQGLPMSSLSGALTPPVAFAQAASAAAPPPMRAPITPPRPMAPPAPPAAAAAAAAAPAAVGAVPPPLAPPPEDSLDGDLLEAEGAYENEGDDFAVAFGADSAAAAAAAAAVDEATSIGGAPPRPSDSFGGMTEPGRGAHAGEAGDTGEHTIAGNGDPDRHNW